jgi:hypothetical protein
MKLLKPLGGYNLLGHKRYEDICQELDVVNISDILTKYRNVLCNHTDTNSTHLTDRNINLQAEEKRPKKRWNDQFRTNFN